MTRIEDGRAQRDTVALRPRLAVGGSDTVALGPRLAVGGSATIAPRRRLVHVPAADTVRVLTFACVIAVHTISTTQALDDPTADGFVMLLHFTREAFFVLTGFVLMHSTAGRELHPRPFWRRRFLLVGVPYVVWTLLYTGLQQVPQPLPPADLAVAAVRNLLTGTGWFHLYFLLVSMQFYLLFPLFRRLLYATAGRHRWLLVAALVAQVGVDAWIHDPASSGLKAALLPYAGSFVGSYVFFLVLGGVVALHRERVFAALRGHPGLVLVALLATGVAAEGRYLAEIGGGAGAIHASDVFQPVMIPWVVAVVAAFVLLGQAWSADGRSPRRIVWASERSFGVFLVHPVFLWALTAGWSLLTGSPTPFSGLPAPLPTVAVYLTAVAASLVAVELLRHTPLRLALTGKPSDRRDK